MDGRGRNHLTKEDCEPGIGYTGGDREDKATEEMSQPGSSCSRELPPPGMEG